MAKWREVVGGREESEVEEEDEMIWEMEDISRKMKR